MHVQLVDSVSFILHMDSSSFSFVSTNKNAVLSSDPKTQLGLRYTLKLKMHKDKLFFTIYYEYIDV